ncbi:MAG: hypothetical protein KGI50_05945 [Patescibacteria group bacterium]|nr:hypothetical protein [Patescibacteria group bacterium]
MSVNWTTLYQGVLTGSPASIYAPGAALQAAIHAANVWNPTAGALTLNLYIVPNSGTANDTTRVVKVSIPAGTHLAIADIINHKIVNPSALYADGNGMTLTISGAVATAS